MFDSWIIEKLQQEENKKRESERPRIQLPVPNDFPCERKEEVVEYNRGVITININEDDDEKKE